MSVKENTRAHTRTRTHTHTHTHTQREREREREREFKKGSFILSSILSFFSIEKNHQYTKNKGKKEIERMTSGREIEEKNWVHGKI